MPLRLLTAPDGTSFRDLDHDGVMAPYEDPRRTTAERVDDLLSRLSLEEKVGLMFHTVIEAAPDGSLLEEPGAISKSATSTVVLDKLMNHFNVHSLASARAAASWSNALQELAEKTPHGIPVTVSTDPRHGYVQNAGVSFDAGFLSQWPEPIGLAALDDATLVEDFARTVNLEYRAIGIRAALHPTVDLCTEPRWGRQAGTLGADPARVAAMTAAYLDGLQQGPVGPTSVACTTKHFPGGGPQKDGEDAHFPYGKDQVYPGGRFMDHLEPFTTAFAHHTSAVMPYYGRPVGLEIDGVPVEEVGFGFNEQIVTGLLRERLGYEGVVLSDWELVNDNHVGDQVLPARAWGVEHLDPAGRLELILHAGVDQLGGEECTELLLELVRDGRVAEDRLDASCRRLLAVKFDLGLFDDPYVDVDAAERICGAPDLVRRGREAQSRSVTVLTTSEVLPLQPGLRVYTEGVRPEALADFEVVTDPSAADVALVRIEAPFEARNDLFLEAWFHQGSLDFPPGLVYRLGELGRVVPLILDVTLDRPAILAPLIDACAALTASYGCCDESWLDALTGAVPPQGRLPFEIPASMDAVRASHADVANDTANPTFPCGHGLPLTTEDPR